MHWSLCCLVAFSALLIFSGDALAQTATCASAAGADVTFENEGDQPVRVFVYDEAGTQVYPYPGGPDNLIDVDENPLGCDWRATFSQSIGTAVLPRTLLTFEFEIVNTKEVYHFAFYPDLAAADDFYHPFAASGDQDAHFRYFVEGSQRDLLVSIIPLFSPLQFVSDFVGDAWVLPYNLDHVCAQPGAACDAPYTDWGVFISPLPGLPTPTAPAYTFAAGADVILPDGYTWSWEEPNLTLRFQGGTRLVVEGTLDAEDVTLTAATDWWEGMDVGIARDGSPYPDASVSFTGSIIEKMWKGTKPNNAVWVHDATATFTNTVIRESQFPFEGWDFSTGLAVEGPSAFATVEQDSEIRDHSGHGIAVYGGARLRLRDSNVESNGGNGLHVAGHSTCDESESPCIYVEASQISSNDGSGVVVESGGELDATDSSIIENGGSGIEARSSAAAYIYGNNMLISDNVGPGIYAYDYSTIYLTPSGNVVPGLSYVDVEYNKGGGLLAAKYATIQAGLLQVLDGIEYCYYWCYNTIDGHSSATGGTAPFDAKATGSSSVYAQSDYWGENITEASHLVLVEEPGSLVLVEPLLLNDPDGGARAGGFGPIVAAGRSDSEAQALLRRAAEAAARDEFKVAFALLVEVIQTAEGDDWRGLAYAEATRLLRRAQPAAVMAFLEGIAEGNGAYRPWALRALVFAYGAQERVPEAEEAAGVLVSEYGESPHVLFGHLARFRLRLQQDDPGGAEAALVAAEAQWPEDERVVAARALLILVTGGETTGGRGAEAASAGSRFTANEGETLAQGGVRLEAPYPNPSRSAATVPLVLGEAAEVRLTVYDVLGREVALLHEGRLAAGEHRFMLESRALPAGLYLVRAEVQTASSAPVLTRRLTLLR